MRALSIKQPWAWLICAGWKDVENRNWYTGFRGRVWIHAGKTFDLEGYEWVKANLDPLGVDPYVFPTSPGYFDRGGIVGASEVTNCVSEMDSPWFFGRNGFVMQNSVCLPRIPCRGQLGFFEVPEVVELEATRLLNQHEQALRAVHIPN